jgi:hypothetical protein
MKKIQTNDTLKDYLLGGNDKLIGSIIGFKKIYSIKIGIIGKMINLKIKNIYLKVLQYYYILIIEQGK